MMNKLVKYLSITTIFVVSAVYIIFLILPFFMTGLINSYGDEISSMVEKSCGFKLKLENMQILTTPKLTVGAKIGHIEIALPTGERFLTSDNVQAKISLIPLIVKKLN